MNTNLAGTSTSSSSLRPRNRRLISIEGDASSRARSLSPVASVNEEGGASVISSRDVSPLPAAHPSRATSNPRSTAAKGGAASTKGYRAPSLVGKSTLFDPGYWETSWSSIQGIASTLLGNDPQASTTSSRRKPPLSQSAKYNVRSPTDKWGPSGSAEQHIAQGSQEDRLAKLQAKKREALLQANGHSEPDRMGQYKRRMSSDEAIDFTGEEHVDTPVYVHHVQKGDTLAGLSIRYNCPQSAIRRANRLYPNDTIQVRKKAYLPVDSCSVRGRKVAPPMQAKKKPSIDLLGEANNAFEDIATTPTRATADWSIASPTTPTSNPQTIPTLTASPTLSATTSATNQSNMEPPQIHDSWVEIDHISEPVEIVRIPCHSLGFFPPRRRRSASYTDTTPPRSPSLTGRPMASSYNNSPNRSTSQHAEVQQRHGRSASSPQQYSDTRGPSNAASYFLEALSGPGGVGSLSRTASPGPAMDRLNEFWDTKLTPAAATAAARAAAAAGVHLPLRGAPMGPTSNALRPTGLGGGLSASRTSLDSVTSAGSEIAGRVEGWVRRTGGIRSPAPGLADSDLIELQEGGGGEASTENRPRRGSTSGREIEEERLLRERFPARGRVFEEQSRSKTR